MNQTEFAKALGIDTSHVSRIENGHGNASPELVLRLAALTGSDTKLWLPGGDPALRRQARLSAKAQT